MEPSADETDHRSYRPGPRVRLGLLLAALGVLTVAAPSGAAGAGPVPVIEPGREGDVLGLFTPYSLGQEIAGGYRLMRVRIEPTYIHVDLEGAGGQRAALSLHHPENAPEGSQRVGSFAVAVGSGALDPGSESGKAIARLLDAVRHNDRGSFFRVTAEPQPDGAAEARSPSGAGWTRLVVVVVVVAPVLLLLVAAGGGAMALRRRLRARGAGATGAMVTGEPRPAEGSVEPAPQPRSRLVAAALLFIASFGAMAITLAPIKTDDAYTVLRYAANWLDHGALVYNLGDRICALTSPLHVLLLSALSRVSGELVITNKVLGSVCFLAALAGPALAFRRQPAALLAIAALLLVSPYAILWAFGGLETPLLLALVTALAIVARKASEGNARASLPVLGFALGGLACVTRYDAVLFVAPVLVGLARRQGARALAVSAAVGAAPPLAWLAFAQHSYGHVLPTSFYVKTPHLSSVAWVASNALYSFELLLFSGLAVVYGVCALLLSERPDGRRTWSSHFGALWPVYAGVLGVFLYGLAAATTHLFYAFRLFVPFLGPAAVLIADLLTRMAGDAPGRTERAAFWVCGSVLALQVVNFAQLAAPWGSISGARSGELRDISARSMTEWVDFLGSPAESIEAHWRAQAASAERRMRLSTFAIGSLPFRLRDAYVAEEHTAYRHRCRPALAELWASSDYICVLEPWQGELPRPDARFVKVFEAQKPLSGSARTYSVFWNPEPRAPVLPPTIDGACLSPAVRAEGAGSR